MQFVVYMKNGFKGYFGNYQDSVGDVRDRFPDAHVVERWSENGVRHERFKNEGGESRAVIQFDPMCGKWPAKIDGFEYV